MYSLGIDIGGTKCAAVLGKGELPQNTDGFILDKRNFPTEVKRGWRVIVTQLLATAKELLKKNNISSDELIGIGISCGGPLDSKKGLIQCPPNLPDWDNVPIVQLFEDAFGVKTYLQNDANACAVAEWKFGAARGYDNAVFLTFGTGMGAGLILNGKLYSGTNDMAGEVGHIRLAEDGPVGYGKRGSFEGFCSGGGIARLAQEMAKTTALISPLLEKPEEMTAKGIAEAARNSDAFAQSVYKTCAEKLGLGLSILIDILNPQAIVIGSIYERSHDLFDPIIHNVILNESLALSAENCKILPAQLGDSIGDFAALGLAFTKE